MSKIEKSIEEKVFKAIDKRKEETIKFYRELVMTPSVSGMEGDAQRLVAKKFKDLGMEVEMVEADEKQLRKHPAFFETLSFKKYGYKDRPNALGQLKGVGGGRSLLVIIHIDTVPAEPIEAWKYPPYGGVIEGGRLYGRGATDPKQGIAAMVAALQGIQDAGLKLKGDLLCTTVNEEEDGGAGGAFAMVVQRGVKADGAIYYGSPPEPAQLPETIGVGVAGAGLRYVEIRVHGEMAHTASGAGVNAIGKAMKIYEAIAKLNEERQKRITYKLVKDRPATNFVISIISAGNWPSNVPALCVMQGRLAWPPSEKTENAIKEFEDALKEVVQGDEWLREHPPEMEYVSWMAEPHEQDPNHPIVKMVMRNTEYVTGKKAVLRGGAGGTDSRHPVLYGGIATVAGWKGVGGGGHSVDEWADLDTTILASKLLALNILEWCGHVS